MDLFERGLIVEVPEHPEFSCQTLVFISLPVAYSVGVLELESENL